MTAKPFDILACSGKKLIKRIFKKQPQHADKNAACGEDGQNESAKKDAEEPAAKGNSSGVSQERQNTHTELKNDIQDLRAELESVKAAIKETETRLGTCRLGVMLSCAAALAALAVVLAKGFMGF